MGGGKIVLTNGSQPPIRIMFTALCIVVFCLMFSITSAKVQQF